MTAIANTIKKLFSYQPTTPTIGNIPNKFYPFIINHPNFQGPQELKQQAAETFAKVKPLTWKEQAGRPIRQVLNLLGLSGLSTAQEPISPQKPFITTCDALDGYIIKQQRTDVLQNRVAPDALLYRVRKAEKIRSLLGNEQAGNKIVVPSKYLYYDANRGTWYLLAEKFTDFNPNKTLDIKTAVKLAEFAFKAGLEDMHQENIKWSDSRQAWVLLDTEPLSRSIKKQVKNCPVIQHLVDDATLRVAFALASLQILKEQMLPNLEASPYTNMRINQVKNNHLDAYFKNSALKIIALCALWYALPILGLGTVLNSIASTVVGVKTWALVAQVSLLVFIFSEKVYASHFDAWKDNRPKLGSLVHRTMRVIKESNPQTKQKILAILQLATFFLMPSSYALTRPLLQGFLLIASLFNTMQMAFSNLPQEKKERLAKF